MKIGRGMIKNYLEPHGQVWKLVYVGFLLEKMFGPKVCLCLKNGGALSPVHTLTLAACNEVGWTG